VAADRLCDSVLRFRAMASEAEIRVLGRGGADDRAALEAAADEVRRIETQYSRYRDDSVVSRINAAAGSGKPVEVDDETAGLLDFAGQLYQLSDGLFDITSGVLRRAWDFSSGRVPEQRSLDDLLPLVGWNSVRRETRGKRNRVGLPIAGMELDFGGFGKEYAADRAAAVLTAAGLRHGFVNLGGDIRVIGPNHDGAGWTLGIRHPRLAQATVAGIEMSSGALATSGDYERYMDVDGRRYCHILDPRSGWPVACWQSVSVVAPVCLAAGALTTIAMLKQAAGLDFLHAQNAAFLAIDQHGTLMRQGL
jgi:thiamine biosynthesis lipoprotein